MTDYYLDIETVPLEQYMKDFDPDKQKVIDQATNKIVTIQFQPMWNNSGKTHGDLTILKEWESDEETIVKNFAKVWDSQENPSIWNFIPIGNNLMFEFSFLAPRLKQYCDIDVDLYHKPFIDIKYILIAINKGQFRKYSELIGKSHEAKNMANWYYSKQWDKITDYIKRETQGFITNYQILLHEMPELRNKLNPNV